MSETSPMLDYKKIAKDAIIRSRFNIANDPELNSIIPNMSVFEETGKETVSCEATIDYVLTAYAQRNALGMRAYDIVEARGQKVRSYTDTFDMKTFGGLQSDIRAIANCWRYEPTLAVARDEFVAIIGFASAEFLAIDTATTYAQAVSVPLQSASSGADLSDIFKRIQPVCLAASYDDIKTAQTLADDYDCVRSLVIFDIDLRVDAERESFEALKHHFADQDIRVLTYAEVVETGEAHTFEYLPEHPEGHERLSLIIHSSGSTGVPKGAMIKAGTVKEYWVGIPEKYPAISVIFSPLNHVLGRASLLQTLGKGSPAYFTLAPDMSTLFEDIRIARPTWLTFFPRVLDMIYQHFQNEVVKAVATGQTQKAAREAVMAEMGPAFLGDRVTSATVGSAPTSQAVKDFMAECFGLAMWDGYGSTEAGAGSVTINGVINRRFVIDYKLRDVPELGYYRTDKPYPRGEFCFKGKNQIKGFYKDPEATKNLLTDDGYIITGDIVEERKPDTIALIDRRKDVVKLSQGEYVAVGPLGAVFEGGSPFIKQIYIFGNSHRAYLVAVIVPDLEAIEARFGRPVDDLDIRSCLREAIQEIAKAESLRTFEAPRDFIIERTPFSQKNGLLSSVRKKLRPALKRQYGEALEALYTKHEQGRETEIEALKNNAEDLKTSEVLKRLLMIHLGLEDGITLADDKNFGELGGDSLGAVNFSLLVEDVFGIMFPADKILDPTANIASWARDVERFKGAGDPGPGFNAVHGAGSHSVDAEALTLKTFLPGALIANSHALPAASNEPNVVLLTGATGFLGRHICLEWLSKLHGPQAELICLVRANDDVAAQIRLKRVFEESGTEMREAFHTRSKNKLTALAADIAMPNFGLSPDVFEALAKRVDRISHVGALVNHRLSYEHLFAPNVTGTAEIIKLALSHTRKPVDFVSTVSVLPLLDRKTPNKETALPAKTVPLSEAYASGYATSKWAAEILLRNACENCSLPINILRGNMMLAHRAYDGAINPSDMFTRLIFSLIATGVAPASFYNSQAVNYDGLPVDLVANSVVNARAASDDGLHVMNIHNYANEVTFSLDSITGWIKAAGHDIEIIEDYGDWFQRFSERLHTLPDADKNKSAINLLPAFQHKQRSDVPAVESHFKDHITALEGGLPVLGQDYVKKILQDLSTLGFFPKT